MEKIKHLPKSLELFPVEKETVVVNKEVFSMDIKGSIYLLFEQSGTFKKVFKEKGFDAFDYDIKNEYGETDYVIDLFSEIEKAYDGKESLFDKFSKDDFLMAFFPCIYFSSYNNMFFAADHNSFYGKTTKEKFEKIIDRANKRNEFYILINKLVCICMERGFRMVIENPSNGGNYLDHNFIIKNPYKDNDRHARGDYFKKPTNFYCVNCELLDGFTEQRDKELRKVAFQSRSNKAGICSKARSEISIDYARNFVKDQILGY
jgi:hypothetical protein